MNVATHVTRRVEINGMQVTVLDGLSADADIRHHGVTHRAGECEGPPEIGSLDG